MNNIYLKIEYDKSTTPSISSLSADKNTNNVSSPLTVITTKNNGANGKSFALGYLSLDSGCVGGTDSVFLSETNKYNGYMFGATSDSGTYVITLTIVGSKAFDEVIITFDKAAQQYATLMSLDYDTENKTVENSSYEASLKFSNSATTHTITFYQWNRANYNACITSISIKSSELVVSRNSLEQLNTQSQYMVDNSTLDYGVVANSGTITIYDTNNFLKNKIEDGTLPVSNAPAIIELNGKQLQSHIISDSDYNTSEQILTLTLNNPLSEYENISFEGIEYRGKPDTLYNTVNSLLDKYNISIDNTVKSFMESLTIEYPYMESSDLRTALEKICRVCRCGIAVKDDGTTYMFNARPKLTAFDNVYNIPKSYMISNLNSNIIKKNKYYPVINYKKPLIKAETGANIYTDSFVPTGYEDNSNNQEDYKKKLDITQGADIYAYVKSYYAYINFQIPKKSKYGLKKVTKVYGSVDGEDKNTNINYSVTYTLKSGVATPKDTNFNLNEFTFSNPTSEIEETGTIVDYKAEIKYSYHISLSTNIVTAFAGQNKTSIVVIEYDDYYKVSTTMLVGLKIIGAFSKAYTSGGETTYIGGGEYKEYVPKTVNFTIYGDTYEIDFENLYTTAPNNTSDKKSITLDGSELVQSTATINNQDLPTYLQTSIAEDYSNGISTANVDIFTGDYGGKVWESGDVAQIGEVVYFDDDTKIDGSQRYWKITGRNYKQDGSPSITLELQEIK